MNATEQSIYDYTTAGFDKFFNRSVDDVPQSNLDSASPAPMATRFDDQQMSGALGNIIRVGNVLLNGVTGRISIYDDTGNEVVRIGELDD